jgi:hypothetical protein
VTEILLKIAILLEKLIKIATVFTMQLHCKEEVFLGRREEKRAFNDAVTL